MRVVHVHAFQMGVELTNTFATALGMRFKPRCLAMCGVCAGRPNETTLGDVVIAERVYRYDVGAIVNKKSGAKARFLADIQTFAPPAEWVAAAKAFTVDNAQWLTQRPMQIPQEAQRVWVLKQLLDGLDPRTDHATHCPQWSQVLPALEHERLLRIDGNELSLTETGRKHIQRVLLISNNVMAPPQSWRVHCGPMGTGSCVVKDVDIWERLEETQRRAIAFEMEASAIGLQGWLQGIPAIVCKGVMDNGDPNKSDVVRAFAARASAEVLLTFLRKHLQAPPGPADLLEANQWSRHSEVQGKLGREHGNPGTMLNARWEVVPFIDDVRNAELTELSKWCDEVPEVSLRLFTGPGGAGKTRLFMEWAARRRVSGWDAGFVPESLSEEKLGQLSNFRGPTLLVFDYAEARRDLAGVLKSITGPAARSHYPVRIALLARGEGEWYGSMAQQHAELAELLRRYKPRELNEVVAEGSTRPAVFQRSLEAFAGYDGRTIDAAAAAIKVDLSDRRFGRMLYLQMAALAELRGWPKDAVGLIGEMVEHEQHFWERRYRRHHAEDVLETNEFLKAASRCIAAMTLLGGSPSEEETRAVNHRIGGPPQPAWVPFLAGLYPGREGAGRGEWVSGLEPDLLGEYLCAQVLRREGAAWIERVFGGVDRTGVFNGLIVLGRLSLNPNLEKDAEAWIGRVLDQDVEERALVALFAAMSLRAQTAHAPIGMMLAERLARVSGQGPLEFAHVVEAVTDETTVSLRELRAWSAQTRLATAPRAKSERLEQPRWVTCQTVFPILVDERRPSRRCRR